MILKKKMNQNDWDWLDFNGYDFIFKLQFITRQRNWRGRREDLNKNKLPLYHHTWLWFVLTEQVVSWHILQGLLSGVIQATKIISTKNILS